MLRITVHDSPQSSTFKLEGSLAGPCLRELVKCWKTTFTNGRQPIVRVDLSGVTFVDAAGKACLSAMRRRGAELIANDCLTKAIVAEIVQAPPHRCRAKAEADGAKSHQRP